MQNKKIYLVGNPNVGKTTIFNALTEKNEKTGNYIGTTIYSITTEIFYEKDKYTICDIAGVYNFEDKKGEETIAWKSIEDAMLEENAIFIQVINAGQWKQSLSLTLDLQKKGIQPILFFNTKKTDNNLGEKFYEKISKQLNVKVFFADVVKLKNKEFKKYFFEVLKNIYQDTYKNNYNILKTPKTFNSLSEQNEYIQNIFSEYVKKQKKTDRLDAIFLHSFFGILTFFVLLYIVFQITFSIGAIPMDWIDSATSFLQIYLSNLLPPNLYSDLLINGVIAGVGGTLIFLPNIILLFFFLSILRESGYLARTSFLFDIFFQKIGISGRASVPLLMGFGCNVPAIMAIKTFETRKEQIIVAMMSVFMSCGARLPVYALLLSIFIPENYRGAVLFCIYLLGILVSFMTGKFLSIAYKRKMQKKMRSYEIPDLIFPNILKATKEAFQKGKNFVITAGTFILPVSIVLWGLFAFPQNENIENSYGAEIGKIVQPVFTPMNFDWKISTALLSGIAAKEVMVTTFAQLYHATDENDSLQENIRNAKNFSFSTAIALIIFILLYTPCMAVIGVIRSELGNFWAIFSIIYPFVIAWIFAFLAYNISEFLI